MLEVYRESPHVLVTCMEGVGGLRCELGKKFVFRDQAHTMTAGVVNMLKENLELGRALLRGDHTSLDP
jgi:hypothetical protein